MTNPTGGFVGPIRNPFGCGKHNALLLTALLSISLLTNYPASAQEAAVEEAASEVTQSQETASEAAAPADAATTNELASGAEAVEDQEASPVEEEPATEEATTEEPAEEAADTEVEPIADEASEPATPDTVEGSGGAPIADVEAAEDVADDLEDSSSGEGWVLLAIVVALFVVPMFIARQLSKSLRMPDHSWKFATAIGTLAAAAVVVTLGEIKFGPDLSGGITLIYELQDTAFADVEEDEAEGEPAELTVARKREVVRQLIGALNERVDPSGTKEVTIREYGQGQIEIIIPKANQQDLEVIERRIYTAGSLEFRITASPLFSENDEIIKLAQALPPGESVVRINDEKVAEWVSYDEAEFGPADRQDERTVKRMAGSTPQALIRVDDGMDVTGEFLSSASSGIDQRGRPEVRFRFDQQGAFRFGRLTGDHLPNASQQKYFLGILLDNKLLSAPSINSKITDQGVIEGNNSQEEVDFVVGILNAGSLPAALNKEPISRETISPTLGAETVEKGRLAIGVSLAIVMVFMVFYYRFAGIVACLALGANLLLILGLMVLIKAAFTLPGLAGLVLTVGMSVDANVLIFERIREELNRGAALRMAIRNGFGRATQTIVDANVTTLITAIVIYKIAPDNVKGFGVTLILGIVVSMYAAIFLSRIVFDVFERTRRLTTLNMNQIVGKSSIDFLGMRGFAAVVSAVVIGVGLVAVFNRGEDLLNIDFTGGSSVTMVLREDQKMEFGEVKTKLDETVLADANLSLVEVGDTSTKYTVSCVNQDVEAVQQILQDTFGDSLQTYDIGVENVAAIPEAGPAAEAGEGEQAPPAPADPFAGGTEATLSFSIGAGLEDDAGVTFETASQLVKDALEATGNAGKGFEVSNDDYRTGSARRFDQWSVRVALPAEAAEEVFGSLRESTNNQPVFPLANKIGGRIAGDMRTLAIASTLISLLFIVLYIWFRFQSVYYGLAAVVALVHDVLVTLGVVSMSAFIVSGAPPLAQLLLIEKFQISLPMVAAFLTIIGYSLNDTIVVFDRIREVKGKSPRLSAEMINTSINQTLSRTLLTSLTTLLTVVILYALGGDGIHGFAFALVVGVIVGTYSSIFIASPALLWMSNRTGATPTGSGAKAA
ncbi:MAG: protein translocase subunit SecD [Planctomycetota bacterium]